MQLECPNCKQMLEFTDKRPSFCGHCGSPLPAANVHEAATRAYTPPPSTAGGDFAISGERPKSVGQYRLVRELGQGGMGVVYEAEHEESGRRVALKLLTPGLAQSQESMERFLREGRLAAALSHPRSTFVYEAGEHAGQPFIAMELMPGRTLHHVSAEEGLLPVNRSVDYILDVIDGLEAAHAAGVIHRDVKPSNCFLDSDGRVKVGDFGLSKSLVGDAALTRTGAFMGTPLFAAPEQVRAGKIDGRTDIYSVGATLFFLIARRGPFAGDPAAVIAQIASDPAPSLRSIAAHVPRDLDQIVARTLEKEPQRRFQTLADLRQALLPFATQGMSPAQLGRRVGAYFVDVALGQFAAAILTGIALIAMEVAHVVDSLFSIRFLIFLNQSLWSFVLVAYFARSESRWGRSVGKALLGLRVVKLDGGRPSFGKALLRSLIVPGSMWLSVAMLFLITSEQTLASMSTQLDPTSLLRHQLVIPLALVPVLICFSSMRVQNGYRGWHELASHTRVVRFRGVRAASRFGEVPVLAATVRSGKPAAFGPFQVIGLLGKSAGADVWLARDNTLGRRAWIHVRQENAAPFDSKRLELNRPARPRWLQGGRSHGGRWDAFEAVTGAPASLALQVKDCIDWATNRRILVELAEELAAAASEGTLPATLAQDQVWIDRDGGTKLLDSPLNPPSATQEAAVQTASMPQGAFELLREASRFCSQGLVLPGHAYNSLEELSRRPASLESLRWAAHELRETAERPAAVTWSDRLVSLACCMGTEYQVYQILISVLVVVLSLVPGIPFALGLSIGMPLAVALPVSAGFWFRGGPIFRLMGIESRRATGEVASRARCALRSLVAWVVPMLQQSGINLMMAFGAREGQAFAAFSDPEWAMGLNGLNCLALFWFVGIVYAVVRPQRGVQDLVAGTCLVPQ